MAYKPTIVFLKYFPTKVVNHANHPHVHVAIVYGIGDRMVNVTQLQALKLEVLSLIKIQYNLTVLLVLQVRKMNLVW